MVKTAGRILKSNDVKFEGRFHLDLAQVGSDLSKHQAVVSTEPQVRVLENHPEYAVIEVTCCCGRKISLKCDYAGLAEQAPEDTQT
jgi:hypothetical protein